MKAHIRRMVLERDGGSCTDCGSTENLTVDHIVPLSRGGTSIPANLVTLCEQCNVRKGNHIPWDWFSRLVMALHIDEHLTNLRNELAAERGGIFGTLRREIQSSRDHTLRAATKLIDNQQRDIAGLKTRLRLLEEHLGVEYFHEVSEQQGYRKRKKA